MTYKTRESIIYTGNTCVYIWCVCDEEKKPMKNYVPEENFHTGTVPEKTSMLHRI
jgi:hypothetical protein